MLKFLFPTLTTRRPRGVALFDALTGEARRPGWYLDGRVPDTLDGRFAVLATVTALALVRLEQDGEDGDSLSVALTERFIHVMESEHRELGQGDPTLGKTVRKLVGMLARRTEQWRQAENGSADWTETARASLYKQDVAAEALAYSAERLRSLSDSVKAATLAQLEQGVIA